MIVPSSRVAGTTITEEILQKSNLINSTTATSLQRILPGSQSQTKPSWCVAPPEIFNQGKSRTLRNWPTLTWLSRKSTRTYIVPLKVGSTEWTSIFVEPFWTNTCPFHLSKAPRGLWITVTERVTRIWPSMTTWLGIIVRTFWWSTLATRMQVAVKRTFARLTLKWVNS